MSSPFKRAGIAAAETGSPRLYNHRMRTAAAILPICTALARYSITQSARARIHGGILRPSYTLGVLRLMTSSNMVGCMTGRSASGLNATTCWQFARVEQKYFTRECVGHLASLIVQRSRAFVRI